MKNIDDEYRDRFRDKEMPADDFDSEGLWDAIADDLGGSGYKTEVRKLPKFWLFLVVGIIGFIGLVGSLNYFSPANSTEDFVKESRSKTVSGSKSIVGEADNKPSKANFNQVLNTKTSSFKKEELKSKEKNTYKRTRSRASIFVPRKKERIEGEEEGEYLTKANIVKNNLSKTIVAQNLAEGSKSSVILENFKENNTPLVSRALTESDMKNTNILSSEIDEQPKKDNNKKSNPLREVRQQLFNPSREVSILAAKPLDWANGIGNLASIPMEKLVIKSADIEPSSLKWQLEAFSGINTYALSFKSDTVAAIAALKKSAEKVELGASVGAKATMLMASGLSFSTGLEYHKSWTKFDYTGVSFTERTLENQLLKVWIDATTGDSIKAEYGSATLITKETRTVIKYNQYSRLTIPLEVNFQKGRGNWLVGLGLGTTLNFNQMQKGKSLDQFGDVFTFDRNSENKPIKDFTLGLRVSPFLGYKLTDKWTVKLNPQWNWIQGQQLFYSFMQSKARQFNVNIGAVYTL